MVSRNTGATIDHISDKETKKKLDRSTCSETLCGDVKVFTMTSQFWQGCAAVPVTIRSFILRCGPQ